MYGLNGRFSTSEAFVMGLDAATGFKLLAEFGPWLLRSYGEVDRSTLSWSGLIVDHAVPEFRARNVEYDRLTPFEDAAATAELFRALDGYLAEIG